MSELAGKVALVTGGARNIGRAIARALAAGGASVTVNARSQSDELAQTVQLIEDAGGHAMAAVADVTDAPSVRRMVDAAVERFGRLDVVVNNAAVRIEQPFDTIAFEDWRRIVSIVLDGAFLCSQAALPHLRRAGGGSIVNIGGLTGHTGATARAHVVTAKAGLAGFTKALALDLAPDAITVNCVVPGHIATERAAGHPGHRRDLPPLGRQGLPEEVAAIVRMLCGPDARYITGQSLHVNGGSFLA
ncbi:MAG TPA: 3-oxoacyl-ACP reductase family protein [Casimicrobiaceae bacterium]|jgi:3-oxoacyl-[acyl-carrier protein] reductase